MSDEQLPDGAFLKDSVGSVVPVPDADIQNRLRLGWTPASPDEVKDFRLQQKFGTPLEKLKTFGEAAAQTLSFGVSTPIETGLLDVPKENIAGRQEANPKTHTAGVLTAVAAPAIASAGASLLGEAPEAALAVSAPGLIARAGEAASGATEAGVRSAIMGGAEGPMAFGPALAQRAIGMGAGSAVEGGLFTASQLVHEAALGDPNLTAQNAIEQIGLGTLLGGGIGLVAGAGHVAIPEFIRKAREATAGAFETVGKGLGKIYSGAEAATGTPADVATTMFEHRQEISMLSQSIPGVGETISNATPQMAKWIVDNGPKLSEYEAAFPGTTKALSRVDPKTADYMLENWQKIITDPQARIDVATNLREGIQNVFDTTENLLKRTNTEFAPREADELIGDVKHAVGDSARQGYADVMTRVNDAASELRSLGERAKSSTAAELEDIYSGLGRDASDDPVEIFKRTKELRSQIGSNTAWKTMPGDIEAQNTSRVMKKLYHDVNDILRNPEVFGEAAARREALDQVQKEWLDLTGRGGAFKKLFLDASGKIPSTKVDTWLNAMAKDKGIEAGEAWGKVMDLSRRITDEAEHSYKSAPVGEFDRAAADSLFNKTAKMVDDARVSGKVTATQKYLSSGGLGIPNSGPVQPNAFGQAAKVVGGFLPNIITNTFKTVTSVPKAVATLSTLERLGMTMGKRIEELAHAIAHGEEDSAAGIVGTIGKDYLRESTHERILGQLEKAEFGAVGSEVGSHEKYLGQLRQLANNPDKLANKLDAPGLQEHAPETTQALQTAIARTIQHVTSKFPAPVKAGPLGQTPKMSNGERFKLKRTLDTVHAPATSVMRHILLGTLTPDVISDASAVAPEQMRAVQSAIIGQISEAKKQIPYRTRLMLSMFLNQSLDGTTTPQSIMAAQAVYNMPSAKSQDNQTGPGAMKSTQTGLAKLNISSRAETPGQASDSRRRNA